jgi:hypothetical protein
MMFLVFLLICLSALSKRLLTPWQLDSHSVTLTISQIPTNNEIRELQESVIDLQCRSMKNNLIFTNLAEQPTEDAQVFMVQKSCDYRSRSIVVSLPETMNISNLNFVFDS